MGVVMMTGPWYGIGGIRIPEPEVDQNRETQSRNKSFVASWAKARLHARTQRSTLGAGNPRSNRVMTRELRTARAAARV